MKKAIEERLENLLGPAIEGLGFELVRIKVNAGKRPTVQVMAERPDRTMTVDDCADVSRELSAILDVEDPLSGEYVLEVSSPGIDRPLTREKDFADFAGALAKLETSVPRDGRRRFKGRLAGTREGAVVLETDQGELAFPFGEVDSAKLVMTDELIRKDLKSRRGKQD